MAAYKPEYCERLRNHCENGRSLESFCALEGVRVSPKTISEWYNEHPEFRDAVDMAPCLELLYWEMQMTTALVNKEKETINVAKSKLDNLSKYVISPLKKNTYSDLKENTLSTSNISSGDAVKDFHILYDKKRANGL